MVSYFNTAWLLVVHEIRLTMVVDYRVQMETDLAVEQGHSVQARVQWGEAHSDKLVHLDGSS